MRNQSLIILVLLIWLVISCEQPQSPQPPGSITLEFVFPPADTSIEGKEANSARALMAQDFDQVHCTVIQNANPVYDEDLPIVGEYFQASIELNEGNGYVVQAEAFIENARCYTGSSINFNLAKDEIKNLTITLLADIPDSATNFECTAVSSSQINLTWTDNSDNEQGFRITRTVSNPTSYDTILVGQNSVSYQDTNLAENTTYIYTICAYNAAGNSPSLVDSAKTGQTLPAAPDSLDAVTVSTSQITVSWKDHSSNEDGFIIKSWKDNYVDPDSTTDSLEANTTNYLDTGLSQNTVYGYFAYAYNSAGNSAPSNIDYATTNPNVPDHPTNLDAVAASATQVNLSWQDNSDNETGFKIERKYGLSGQFSTIFTTAQDITQYQDVGLTSGNWYFYQVRAYNSAGTSGPSNPDSVNMAIPSAPSNLIATANAIDQIILHWDDNSNNEDGFIIHCTSGSWDTTYSVDSNSENFPSTNLRSGTTYTYQVCAFNGAGLSEFCAPDSATTFLNVIEVGYCNLPTTIYDIDVDGDYAYVADDYSGLYVVNFITPPPFDTEHIDTTGYACGVDFDGDCVYIAHWNSGLWINIIDSQHAPSFVSLFDLSDDAYDVVVSNETAFVAVDGDGLQAINVANPPTPEPPSICPLYGNVRKLAIAGDYAYVSSANEFFVINIANPDLMESVGHCNLPQSDNSYHGNGIAYSGDYAYVENADSGLVIIDVSIKTHPFIASVYNDFDDDATCVAVSGNYAFVGDYYALQIVNISDPENPVKGGRYEPDGYKYAIAVSDDYILLGQGSSLRVLKIQSP